MKLKEKEDNEAADALISIIRSVTNYDPELKSRDRESIYARQLFYKIWREVKGWSFHRTGALLGKDHATVRHGIKTLEDIMSYDGDTLRTYNRILGDFVKTLNIGEELKIDNTDGKRFIYEKLIETNEILLKQNEYIAEIREDMALMKKQIQERNSDYNPIIELLTNGLPKSKINSALPKIRKVLNGL